MKYVSIFSGIEAATVAWHPLGWEPLAFSEIDPFPSTVLQHHYPDIPNLGDITKIDWRPYVGAADIVVGGSPCQSFSVAGKREGLAGASGLMFEYIRAVRELRPRWFVWENVPGAFTSERGEAYRQLLSEMDALGYGLAWRVLDAQFFGVAQRRERVFLVGSLGTMRCAEVLFERESLSWDHQSSRQKRQALTDEAQERFGEADHDSGCLNPGETQSRRVYPTSGVYPTLSTREKSGQSQESVFLCQTAHSQSTELGVGESDVMNTLDTTNNTAVAALDFKVKPVAFLYSQGAKARSLGISEISPTLKTDHNPVVAFASNQHDEVLEPETDGALPAQPGAKQQTYLCQMAQTGSNGKLVKQDDVMNTLDRTNSTAIAALDFNPTDARLRYAQDDVSQTLTARAGTGGNQVPLVQVQPLVFNPNAGINEKGGGFALSEDVTPTLKTDHNPAVAFASNQRDEVRELEVAGALAAQPGIKQQTYICRADGQTNAMTSVDMAPTLTSHAKKDPPLIYPAEDSTGEDEPVTLQIHGGKPGGGKGALIQRDMSATLSTHNTQTPITGGHEKRGLTVRRLTPRECERLQGFPTITPISHIGTRNTLRTEPVTKRWATAWPYQSCDGSENAFTWSKKPINKPISQHSKNRRIVVEEERQSTKKYSDRPRPRPRFSFVRWDPRNTRTVCFERNTGIKVVAYQRKCIHR